MGEILKLDGMPDLNVLILAKNPVYDTFMTKTPGAVESSDDSYPLANLVHELRGGIFTKSLTDFKKSVTYRTIKDDYDRCSSANKSIMRNRSVQKSKQRFENLEGIGGGTGIGTMNGLEGYEAGEDYGEEEDHHSLSSDDSIFDEMKMETLAIKNP